MTETPMPTPRFEFNADGSIVGKRFLEGEGGILTYTDNTEQGFTVRTTGRTSKLIEDFEGLFLPKTPVSP